MGSIFQKLVPLVMNWLERLATLEVLELLLISHIAANLVVNNTTIQTKKGPVAFPAMDMTGVILIGGVDNWNKQMKLLFENWRGYIKESNSGTVEERILNDIFSGKTLEEIKTQYKFSSPEKERIVEGAYEYVTNSNRPAAFNTILSTYKVLYLLTISLQRFQSNQDNYLCSRELF